MNTFRNERQAHQALSDAADEAERIAAWVRKNTPAKPEEDARSKAQAEGCDSMWGLV